MIPRLTYLRVKEILAFQKKVLNKKIQSVSSSHIVYEGLSCFDNGAHEIDPMDIPGVSKLSQPNVISNINLINLINQFYRGLRI
jgi:hypothetical protein